MVELQMDEDGGWRFTTHGHLITIITPETPRKAVDKFYYLCNLNQHQLQLHSMAIEYQKKVAWNGANRSKAKDWPIFRQRERYIKMLLDMAGVIDT